MDLSNVSLTDLVREIERRSECSFVSLILKEGQSSPEANIRIFQWAEKKKELALLGVVELGRSDVLTAVRKSLLGEDQDGF